MFSATEPQQRLFSKMSHGWVKAEVPSYMNSPKGSIAFERGTEWELGTPGESACVVVTPSGEYSFAWDEREGLKGTL